MRRARAHVYPVASARNAKLGEVVSVHHHSKLEASTGRQTPGGKVLPVWCVLPGGRRWATSTTPAASTGQQTPGRSVLPARCLLRCGRRWASRPALYPLQHPPLQNHFFAGQCSCFSQSDPRGPALRNSTSETAAGKAAATHPTDESGRPDRADLPGGSDAPEAVPTGLREPICPTEPTGPIEPIHATDPTEPSEWGHCRR